MLAAVSFGVGERQEGVKGVETGMVARFGEVRQAGKRARAEQSARRHPECGDKHAGIMHTRGHCVHYGIEPRLAPVFMSGDTSPTYL